MENNNNFVTLLHISKDGNIGIDSQVWSLLSQIIITQQSADAERRKEYERRETSRHEMEMEARKLQIKREELEIERIKFQIEREKFNFDLEKAERLSRKKENNFNK